MKTKLLRKIIAGKNYRYTRMTLMDSLAQSYMEKATRAETAVLRDALNTVAMMYLKRYNYYGLRKSI